MTTCYKIRYKHDPELYVKGTPQYNSYDKEGRLFSTLGKLRTFLTGVMNGDHNYNKYYSNGDQKNRVADWEIVEIEMVEKDVKGVHEIITAKKLKELIMR